MSRPLRLEFPGALYHVTSRGNRRAPIFMNDNDRYAWIDVVGKACSRFNFTVHAYCQMGNHYHLLLETVEGNLSRGMRYLNAAYTQNFNRRHNVVGHLLQGRYKAILVQRENYLLELCRYVVLNPVRAGVVESPRDWKWSNYRASSGYVDAPDWLATEAALAHFGDTPESAIKNYQRFVHNGIGRESPLRAVAHQYLLGDADFIKQYGDACTGDQLHWVTKPQRKAAALSLPEYQARYPTRDEAMARAYWTTAYTMSEIGKHFGVGYSTVSRAVARMTGLTRDQIRHS